MTDPREPLGRIVHETRLAHEAERAAAEGRQAFYLGEWEKRTPNQQELDERIGSVVAEIVTAEVRGQFGHALREHYLAGITCDRARNEDNPVCACSRVFLGWHRGRRPAVEAWIGHVMEVAGGGEDQERAGEKGADHG